jgi:hypothetical protein
MSYTREKRVLLTRTQELRLKQFLDRLEEAMGGLKITSSDLSRSVLALLFAAEPEILHRATLARRQCHGRPATADKQGMAALEKLLADVIRDGLRAAARTGET